VLSGLALSSCAEKLAERKGQAPLGVAIPDTCERILRPVPMPQVAETDDGRVAFVRDEAALITANGRIIKGRDCIADVRADLAAMPKK
jgi:hypothetical protein